MATVLVAMSGGVDSSLAAALLVEQGHRVIGATMKTFCYTDANSGGKTCCGLDGIMDARRVAETLGMPHYVFDMEASFGAAVIDDFVSEYSAGRTPNPCVRCNSNTKIPDLLRRARLLGADWIATGHYARAVGDGAAVRILRGLHLDKDQSYFLWGVPREVLPHLRFPVGELTKPEVRERARALGLATADKPESQEICFVPGGDYTEFLEKKLGSDHASLNAGALVTSDGTVIGEHGGYARYTVGQRKGLGGGRGRPLFVLGVNAVANQVTVGTHDELYRSDVAIRDVNWLGEPPAEGETVSIQLRHRAAAVAAVCTKLDDARAAFRLAEPQRAVTPGQSGVVYRDDALVGGGRIDGSG
ncbi:MAG TPA: tRNA 2-thiouridine(34) synthase MnmA [Longimicrobiales bacterium]|nr:tRNA 2-thiouridine(34) synthase MnmA [Longimicrobiales bacterium]